MNIRIFDKATESEITEGIIFFDIKDRENYGRKMIAVVNHAGIPMNVGILNQDGSTEAQPGFEIEVTK